MFFCVLKIHSDQISDYPEPESNPIFSVQFSSSSSFSEVFKSNLSNMNISVKFKKYGNNYFWSTYLFEENSLLAKMENNFFTDKNICRLCGDESTEGTSIFHATIFQATIITLINKYLPIEVSSPFLRPWKDSFQFYSVRGQPNMQKGWSDTRLWLSCHIFNLQCITYNYLFQVSNNDNLPKVICQACTLQLYSTITFLEVVISGQGKLKNIFLNQKVNIQRLEKAALLQVNSCTDIYVNVFTHSNR